MAVVVTGLNGAFCEVTAALGQMLAKLTMGYLTSAIFLVLPNNAVDLLTLFVLAYLAWRYRRQIVAVMRAKDRA